MMVNLAKRGPCDLQSNNASMYETKHCSASKNTLGPGWTLRG